MKTLLLERNIACAFAAGTIDDFAIYYSSNDDNISTEQEIEATEKYLSENGVNPEQIIDVSEDYEIRECPVTGLIAELVTVTFTES